MKGTKKQKVAIFDIDGTIFRSSLLIELVDALIEEGLFPASVTRIYAKAYQKWLDRKGSYDDYIHAVARAYDHHIKGVSYKAFLNIVHKVAHFHSNRVYRYTRDLIEYLRKHHYYLLALSHSPHEIVQEFCKDKGFSAAYGIQQEVRDGRFTGNILERDICFDKAKKLKLIVKHQRLTLKGSIGVGDSESDIPFLKLVDQPICFNPSYRLYQYAKRNHWKVVVERKNVIYQL
jgi:HAD superfamily hydrolase (TIGR01490 family)